MMTPSRPFSLALAVSSLVAVGCGPAQPGTGEDGGGGGSGGGDGQSAWDSGVGPTGGTTDLLHFAVTGDTRPPNCATDTSTYPTPIITAIADAAARRQAQFFLDLGDHMFVCDGSRANANAQMGLYMQSMQHFPGTTFMTMGNHECSSTPCGPGSASPNYGAFVTALAPISPTPYYSFNVETSLGRATFVVVADNAWSADQQAWLESTLADADVNAKYTIVARHHPENDTSVSTNPTSMAIIRAHKFALFLTGHSHQYRHPSTDNHRDMVMGLGGAPLSGTSYNGYAMIDQLADGTLRVTVYSVTGDLQQDQWSVGPNP
jgi:hypothetical protein